MFEQILSQFESSPQGQSAVAALQQQGIPADQANEFIQHAKAAAAESMGSQTANHPEPTLGLFNIFGGHAAREFLVGLTMGIARGDGFVGSFKDGGMSMIAGHIGEVVAERAGVDEGTAGTVAAAITPFIIHFVHEKLAGMHPA